MNLTLLHKVEPYRNKIAAGVLLAMLLSYIIYIYNTVSNAAFMLDDSKCYISQFIAFYIEGDLQSKFDFLIKPTNWPHPKLASRLASILLYTVFGSISFFNIKLIAAFGIISFTYLMYRYSDQKQNLLIFIPVFLVLWSPNISNHWAVMMSRPFSSILVLASFYFIVKDKILIAGLLSFLLSFNTSTGMIIFPIGLVLMAILHFYKLQKVSLIKWLTWILSGVLTIVFFYTKLLKGNTIKPRTEEEFSMFSLGELFELFEMLWGFVLLNVKLAYGLPSLVMMLIGFGSFLYVSYKVYVSVRNKKKNHLMYYFTLLHVLGTAAVGTVFLYDRSLSEQVLNPRYAIYSYYYLSLLAYLILATKELKLTDYIKIGMLTLAFIPVLSFSLKYSSNISSDLAVEFKERIADGLVKEKYMKRKNLDRLKGKEAKNYRELKIYRNAINRGLYVNEDLLDLKGIEKK